MDALAAIFISHASLDGSLAADVKRWLASRGYEQVFLDLDKAGGLRAGEDWERRLYQEVARCHAVILLITPAWLASKWCFAEFTMARSLGKVIFPIVLAPDQVAVVGPELRSIQMAQWNEEGQAHLAARLEAVALEIARGHRYDPRRSPYPGILSFDAEDAAVFFGRDRVIREIAERLEAKRVGGGARLLLVVGATGSGKSSVLKAGVLPWIGRDSRAWIVLPAFRPGDAPITRLAKVLAEATGRAEAWPQWRQRLAAEPRATLAEAVGLLQVGPALDATLIVAIDQFEEAFTIAEASERAAFLRALTAAADRQRPLAILILATLRSDLMGEILKTPGFDLAHDVYTLGPLAAEQLSDVIEGPAGVAAIVLEPGLSRRMLEDAKGPESLPLLAFALRELYARHGPDKRLAIRDYEQLGDSATMPTRLSPLESVVRRKAEDALRAAAPSPAELAALMEAFVGSLVRVNEEGVRLRRPAALDDLPAPARPLVELLVQARLLGKRQEGEATLVEVAHEALFRAWPLLASWLDEEQDFLIGRRQIEEAERLWLAAAEAEKDRALLAGLLLDRAREWIAQNPERLARVRPFVEASIARDDAEKARIRRLNEQALIGQSRLLADLARQRSEEGDHETAALLALEALPDNATKVARPYVPQAEAALYRALAAMPEAGVRLRLAGERPHFSSDGRRLVTAIGPNGYLWDAANGQQIAALSCHTGKALAAVFSPDDRRVATRSEEDGTVRIWNAVSGAELLVLRAHQDGAWHKGGVWNVAFSPDGGRIATCSPDRTARVWDAASGAPMLTLRHDHWVGSVAFLPDGTRIVTATVATQDRKATTAVRIWDAVTGAEIAVLPRTENAELFCSPDGARIATISEYRVCLWEADGKEIGALLLHDGDGAVKLAFSPDGTRIVTRSDHVARLWDAADGAEIAQLRRPREEEVRSVAFLSSGIRIVTGAQDGTVRIFDAASGAEVAAVRVPAGRVRSASVTPDGARLIAVSEDGTAGIWDQARRLEIAVLAPGGAVSSATLSPDGTRILTSSAGGVVGDISLWRLFAATQDLVDQARSVVSRELTPEQRRQFFLA
jgi:WD40 repeat protein